jgi:hypothetical protein
LGPEKAPDLLEERMDFVGIGLSGNFLNQFSELS